MVSSTFQDLRAERDAARVAIQGQRMLPLMMETDSAIPNRGLLTNSLAMLDEAVSTSFWLATTATARSAANPS